MSAPRRLLLLLLLHSTLTQVITFVLRPAATYRAIELDVPAGWLGALTACFAVVPLVLAVPAGQATDRFGERRVVLLGSLLMLVAGAVFLVAPASALGLVGGTALLGTAHLFCVVGQQAAVANSAGPGTFDTVFGYYTFAASLGQAVGPGLIILAGGGRAIPDTTALFAIATALGAALVGSALPIRVPRRPRTTGAGGAAGLRLLLRIPGLLRALVISCVVLAAVDITLVYLPALGADRRLAAGFIGLLLTLRALASMISRFLLGRLARRFGRRRLMIASVTLSAVAMAAIGLPLPGWATAVLVVLLGLGLGVGQPLTMSWLAETAPAGLRGRAMSLRLTGNRLGQVVIPSAVGAVAAGVGAAGVLGATALALGAVAAAARGLRTDGPPPVPTGPAAGPAPEQPPTSQETR
jgi:MFS family permease